MEKCIVMLRSGCEQGNLVLIIYIVLELQSFKLTVGTMAIIGAWLLAKHLLYTLENFYEVPNDLRCSTRLNVMLIDQFPMEYIFIDQFSMDYSGNVNPLKTKVNISWVFSCLMRKLWSILSQFPNGLTADTKVFLHLFPNWLQSNAWSRGILYCINACALCIGK